MFSFLSAQLQRLYSHSILHIVFPQMLKSYISTFKADYDNELLSCLRILLLLLIPALLISQVRILDVEDLTLLISSGEKMFSTDSRYILNAICFTYTTSGTEIPKLK